jgi:hypothetical protein
MLRNVKDKLNLCNVTLRQQAGCCFLWKPSLRTFAVNASFNLEALADAFDAELYAELLEREGGPGRGLTASHASKTSPLVVVPMSSALIVADPGLPAAHQYTLKSPLAQVYPSGLQALMMGVIPEAYGVWNLWIVQLAAALLWLKSSQPAGAQPHSSGGQLQQAWQQYIRQVSYPTA